MKFRIVSIVVFALAAVLMFATSNVSAQGPANTVEVRMDPILAQPTASWPTTDLNEVLRVTDAAGSDWVLVAHPTWSNGWVLGTEWDALSAPIAPDPAAMQPTAQPAQPTQTDDMGFSQTGICDFAQADVIFNFPAPVLPMNSFYQTGTGSGQDRNILVWMPSGGTPVASFGAYYTFVGPVTASCLASQLDQTSATQIVSVDGTVIMVLNGNRVETPQGQMIFER